MSQRSGRSKHITPRLPPKIALAMQQKGSQMRHSYVMTKPLLLLSLFLSFAPFLFAQCSFVPTVSPNNLILCPNTSDMLQTEAYDSYQWLRDGQVLPGEVGQTLMVDAYNFGGSQVQVVATLNGCTDTSAAVLVDGWVFLLPYVIIETNCIYDPTAEAWRCGINDTMKLTMGDPYDTLITWRNNQTPIVGANAKVFYVNASGSYTVSGSPLICPTFSQTTDVPVDVIFATSNDLTTTPLLLVQPNPARDLLRVRYPQMLEGRLRLIAADGREMLRQTMLGEEAMLSLTGLPSGIYLLQMESQTGQVLAQTKVVHLP